MANCIKLSSNAIAVTTITTIPKVMKVKFYENISGNFCCTDDNLPSVCRLSIGHIINILETIFYVKLKLTRLVVGDVELTKRQYLHHSITTSSPTIATIIMTTTTTIATTAKTTTINSATTAMTKTTSAATTSNKPKGNKAKLLGNIKTVLK